MNAAAARSWALFCACGLTACWATCPEDRVSLYGRCMPADEVVLKRPVWEPDAAVLAPPVAVEPDLTAVGAEAASAMAPATEMGPAAQGGAMTASQGAKPATTDPGMVDPEMESAESPAPSGPPAATASAQRGCQGECCSGHCAGCVAGQCPQCRGSADCTAPERPYCDSESGTCEPCRSAADCVHIVDQDGALPACDAASGRCVQCTADDNRACGVDLESLQPLVCDARAHRCSSLRQSGSDACDRCIADAQCRPGQRCVPEFFDGRMLGYVCLWVPGSEALGGPSDCLSDGRPYVDRRTRMISIDGEQTEVCALRATSCKALSEHGAKVLGCASVDDRDACGHRDLPDAECRAPQDSTAYRCVAHCGTSDDCKRGFACNTASYPSYCAVQLGSCFADTDCNQGQFCIQRRCQVVHP